MLITERYKEQITGVLSCYDRIVIQGTLPGWCYDQGMTAFLYSQGIRIFDYPGFAQGLRVFSAMEACTGYKPWHDKNSGKTFLRYDSGKCLHYYFYFIDKVFGLCYLRVSTWCPFRLQFYFNGHNRLAHQLDNARIPYVMNENAFLDIDDFSKAQDISDSIGVEALHAAMDVFAERYCPVIKKYDLKLPMEHHAGRIRHRYCFQKAGRFERSV
jgi:hypothetical protein